MGDDRETIVFNHRLCVSTASKRHKETMETIKRLTRTISLKKGKIDRRGEWGGGRRTLCIEGQE